jgi:hypothetical protein
MSGGGGGGYDPPVRAKFSCETGQIVSKIASVDLKVLAKLKVGNILDVEVRKGILMIYDGDGELLGSIIHPNAIEMIECINQDFEYEAEITIINTPSCTVIIKRK